MKPPHPTVWPAWQAQPRPGVLTALAATRKHLCPSLAFVKGQRKRQHGESAASLQTVMLQAGRRCGFLYIMMCMMRNDNVHDLSCKAPTKWSGLARWRCRQCGTHSPTQCGNPQFHRSSRQRSLHGNVPHAQVDAPGDPAFYFLVWRPCGCGWSACFRVYRMPGRPGVLKYCTCNVCRPLLARGRTRGC
jgi:hypothetical protein